MSENLGGIDITIALDTAQLLDGAKDVQNALSQIDSSSKKTGQELDGLDNSTSQTGSAFTELAGYANSMDNQLRKLNTNVSGIARAMEEARSGTGGASSEFSRAESIIEALGNQLAVLDEAQENGARSAAVLAAQLRAGSKATDEEKQKIGELTGRLYDMKTGVENGAKGTGSWKTSMQQAGYQVQDFIVQVQGGQSALVAFAQQGSQLAGAFGPGGAVVGAIIALGSVLAGVLITSLNGGKNAMDALKDAAEAMDKVITISSQGVAALSDKYAALARVNADVATLLRNQALLEYNQAISKIPKAISDASDAFITLGDRALAAVGGASPSIKKFNDELSALGVTTTDWSQAIQQANSHGQYASGIVNSLSATVSTLSSRLGISKQSAFDLARELSDLSNNPSPEALQELAKKLQEMQSSSKDGQSAIAELAGKLVDLAREAANAKINVDSLNKSTDNLTAGQKNLIKQSERNLALSKLQGEARARLQAQYAAEDAGFAKDDPHAKQMEDDAAATYKNTQAQKTLQSEQKKGASQAESIAQKLANLKQQSELAADSTNKLSREQAILNAQQSLGKGATKEQIALAGQYAAKKWDTANAIKAQAAAEKLLPEARENASYKQDVEDLNTALAAKKISQEQFNQTSERLEATHQANLAKIRADQAVSPQQEAAGGVDPVQQLVNENNQKLALMQQYQQQEQAILQQSYQKGKINYDQFVAAKAATDAQYLALKTAQENQFNEQMTAAQWQLLSQQGLGYEMLTSAVDAFSGNASNALTGLITGTMSAQDAMRSLGNTMLNSVVNALVQVGVEALKNFIIGQTLGAAATAASATEAVFLAKAWAPAAAFASLASFGGNSVPAMTGIASTVGLAQGLALTGMRYNGGPVNAGGLYQVGERGKPEIYQASTGKQYMIPGDNGRVISNKDMQSGSGVIINNIVQNYTSATVDSQGTVNSDGSITLTTIIADLNNGGPISQGITSNFNVKRTPNGQG
ncbi:tail protein (tape measure) [Enterobacter hormaechei]|uniref:Tail protein (Tape measure) n=3 Tax=Enterobacter hormaechei TaxID=158836 RepID=A0AAE4EBG7_9ENTR|nr:tail protein (tape measure) [Enterobacter hormaechei]HBO0728162.1 tail protein (tape measure) [Enterobacter hormaechei subsp. xiangfangensis]MDS0021848.1 tail protein (tape measure) [Enterobacter hormaechei subsp. steigerwaltii]MDS0108922.1 tail protein (tape measure) [Enterobacter hormaechei subsp. steigerwaltii]HBO0738162.1 tail protein (tape measure) [Enterobacter hormaechei subsp. xiangfangensis]HBO0743086.1 tail protein (tape measure) [Enterobacter hormaechei subsp. xiangfangensis]